MSRPIESPIPLDHDRRGPAALTPPAPQIKSRQLLRDPLNFYLTLARDYGDVVCYRPSPEPAYLVNHPDFVKHILVDNNRNYTKDTYSNRMFKTAIGDGLITSEGDTWRRQRRLMQPAFHHERLERLDTVIIAATASLLERWQDSARRAQPILIAQEMASLTLEITTQILFGVDLGPDIELISQAVEMGSALLEKPKQPRFQAGLKVAEPVINRIITRRRQSQVDSGDVLSMLMQVRDEETGLGLSDRQLRDQVITLLLAGYETTSSALTWTWYLLSQHPQVAARMRAEIVQALGDRQPGYADLARLAYCGQVFKESMRLYPSAWVIGRKAIAADRLGDYSLPSGSIIAISPYTLHRHPRFWDNPEAFDPDRFSPPRSTSRHRYAYIPFGSGPRQCIGNSLAMLEAQLILSMVARRFTLNLVPDHEIKPEAVFVLRPDQKMRMEVALQSD